MRSATRLQALAGTSFGRAVYAVERYMPRTTHRDRFSDKEPSPRGLASYEVNAGAAVSFSPGANYFRGRRREPEPGTTRGARRCFACEGRPLAPYGTLATSENKRGDPRSVSRRAGGTAHAPPSRASLRPRLRPL